MCVKESHKLPQELQEWLFPPDGGTRDLETLQVTFGSGDDFFAFDKHRKISNRDRTPETLVSNQQPELSPSKNVMLVHILDSAPKKSEAKPVLRRLERRRTDLFTKTDSKMSIPNAQRTTATKRRSVFEGKMVPFPSIVRTSNMSAEVMEKVRTQASVCR